MCEVLVHLGHPDSGDPAIEQGRYKLGDIVTIREDGHSWGRMESKAAWIASGEDAADWGQPFFIVKIPGLAASVLEDMLESDGFLTPEADGMIFNMTKRRKRLLDVDLADAAFHAAKDADGEITVTTTQIKNLFRNKSDGSFHDMGL